MSDMIVNKLCACIADIIIMDIMRWQKFGAASPLSWCMAQPWSVQWNWLQASGTLQHNC